MQINGLREFAASFTTSLQNVGQQSQDIKNTIMASLHSFINNDTLDISDAGKRLSLKNTEEIPSLVDVTKDKTADYVLKAEQILESMHEIAVLASDNTLKDINRVDMQIEMEDLRDQLAALPESLGKELTGKAPIKYLKGADNSTFGENTDSLLERMRIRIMNGQEWDVREALAVEDFAKGTDLDDDGTIDVYEEYSAGEYYIVDDQPIYDAYAGEWTDTKVKTVREKLEEGTPFLVMDAESAEKAAESLKQKLQMVTDYRNDMATGKTSQDPGSVYSFLKTIDSPYKFLGNAHWGSPLNNSSYFSTDSFLHRDGVHNTPIVGREVVDLGRSDIPLAEAEGAEKDNAGGAQDTGYVLDILSDAEIEALLKNKETEIITLLPSPPSFIDVPDLWGVYGGAPACYIQILSPSATIV